MKRPLLDICILTYKRQDLLLKCLTSVQKELETLEDEARVFVLDNGSEPTMKIEHPLEFTRKRLSPNRGFPAGASAAINMGTSPLVLFLSDDIELIPGALQSLLRTMDKPDIGLCGLKLLFPADSVDANRPAGKVQHVGHAVSIRGQIIHPLIGWSDDNPKTCVSGEVFSVTGAAFMVRRRAWKLAGGFDEVFAPGCFEDVDLALKIRSLGYKIWLDANAKAWHYVSATGEQFPISRNKNIFDARWSSTKMVVWDEWLRW